MLKQLNMKFGAQEDNGIVYINSVVTRIQLFQRRKQIGSVSKILGFYFFFFFGDGSGSPDMKFLLYKIKVWRALLPMTTFYMYMISTHKLLFYVKKHFFYKPSRNSALGRSFCYLAFLPHHHSIIHSGIFLPQVSFSTSQLQMKPKELTRTNGIVSLLHTKNCYIHIFVSEVVNTDPM